MSMVTRVARLARETWWLLVIVAVAAVAIGITPTAPHHDSKATPAPMITAPTTIRITRSIFPTLHRMVVPSRWVSRPAPSAGRAADGTTGSRPAPRPALFRADDLSRCRPRCPTVAARARRGARGSIPPPAP